MLQPHPPIRWSPFWLTTLGTTGLLVGSLAVFWGAGVWSVNQPWGAAAVVVLQAALIGIGAWKLGPIQSVLSSRQRTVSAAVAGAVAAAAVGCMMALRNAFLAQLPPGALIGFQLDSSEWGVARTFLSLIGGCGLMALAAGIGHALTLRSPSAKWQRISQTLYRQAAIGVIAAAALYMLFAGRGWGLLVQALA